MLASCSLLATPRPHVPAVVVDSCLHFMRYVKALASSVVDALVRLVQKLRICVAGGAQTVRGMPDRMHTVTKSRWQRRSGRSWNATSSRMYVMLGFMLRSSQSAEYTFQKGPERRSCNPLAGVEAQERPWPGHAALMWSTFPMLRHIRVVTSSRFPGSSDSASTMVARVI